MPSLESALASAVSKSLSGEGRKALLFSGGLDSSVLALLAKKAGASPPLICAGVEGSEDARFSREVARQLGMRLVFHGLKEGDLPPLRRRVDGIVPGCGPMKSELGMLLLACCDAAKKEGISALISGTGAEELFLGYSMHAQKREAGANLDSLRDAELSGLHEKDIERSEKIAAHSGVRLLLPYLFPEVVRAALAIPAVENFRLGENKAVLRSLARKIGLPETACSRPKRAMQYGSGIHSAILRLRKRGDF